MMTEVITYKIFQVYWLNDKDGKFEAKFLEMDLKERPNKFVSHESIVKYIKRNPEKFYYKEVAIMPYIEIGVPKIKKDETNIGKGKDKQSKTK